MDRIIVDEEIKKIREKGDKEKRKEVLQDIIKKLEEGGIRCVRSAVYLAEEHSMLHVIPISYLVLFVESVLIWDRGGKELNDDVKLAYKISTLDGFYNMEARKKIKKLFRSCITRLYREDLMGG